MAMMLWVLPGGAAEYIIFGDLVNSSGQEDAIAEIGSDNLKHSFRISEYESAMAPPCPLPPRRPTSSIYEYFYVKVADSISFQSGKACLEVPTNLVSLETVFQAL